MFWALEDFVMVKKPTYEALERRLEGLEKRILECEEKEYASRRRYTRLLSLVESLPFDFFAIDANGRYEMQNSACKERWGNVIGKRPQDLSINSDTLALWQDNNRRAMSGETVRADVAFPVAGEQRHFHNIISPILEDGEVEGIVGINIDITKRKRTEEDLQAALTREQEQASKSEAIIAGIGDPITIIDTDFTILYENEIHQGIFGKHIGEHCYMAYQNSDQVCEGCPAAESLKDGKIHKRERTFQSDKGTRYFEITASPFFSSTGEIAGVIEVVRDTTERKLAEEVLRETNEELRAKTRSLDELNTALKVLLERREKDKEALEENVVSNVKELISPYVETLRNTKLDTRQMTCVDIIEANLKEIVSPFLQKLASKYFGLTPKEIQVADLVKQGKTTKEIAALFNLSTRAVKFHRQNIRAKLGLKNQRTNLASYLLSLP